MREEELKIHAAELESTLILSFYPSFLEYAIIDDYIHIILSCSQFRNLTINERASLVYSKLKQHDLEVLNNTMVIVETYTMSQIEDLIEFYL